MPLNKIIDDDINRRKNEAIKRANEAHKKATEKQEQEKNLLQEESKSTKPQPESQNQKAMTKNIFEALMEDSERTMILVLILLLVDEGADMGIILALMYLII